MALRLVIGPARSGKLGVVARAFLEALERGERPVLVAPERASALALERELAARAGAIAGGEVVTWDALCNRVLTRTGGALPAAPDALRGLLLRRAATLPGGPGGMSSALGRLADEAAEAGLDGERLAGALREADAGHMADVLGGWRAALELAGLSDRAERRAEAARRAGSRLDAWDGRPVLVYGFDDLRGAQLALLEALAARADVTVALPFEAGRPAYAPLSAAVTYLAERAAAVEELPPSRLEGVEGLDALERGLFSDRAPAPHTGGAGVRLIEAAGTQAEADAVAGEIAALLRAGLAPDEIVVAVPSPERARGALAGALEAVGVPYALDARLPLPRTPFGHALLALCRFAWLGGSREDLFAWLRSPASGTRRATVDSWEGKVRGRGRTDARESYELVCELAGRREPAIERLRAAADPLAELRAVLEESARCAFGLDARVRRDGPAATQVRAWSAALGTLRALEGADPPPATDEIATALETTQVRLGDDRPSGRVRIVALARLRAHTAAAVFVLGLEEGILPGRDRPDALRTEAVRAALERSGAAPQRDREAFDRYLFTAAAARATRLLVLVRRAAADDGAPLTPSPFWNEALRALDGGAPPVERRGLGELTQPLEIAPSERERLRAVARIAADDPVLASRVAEAHGEAWARRIVRARRAFSRPTRIADRELLHESAARVRYPVSELEAFLGCSARWFVERALDPRDIDATADAKTRGSVAHAALNRFFTRLPAALGTESLVAADLERAEPLLREVIAESLAAVRLPPDSLPMLELGHRMLRDLRAFLYGEVELRHRLVPRRLEVSFGSASSAPGLKDGLVLGDFAVSGRIDRIDQDPMSARGLIQDYKYSTRSDGADDIEKRGLLQLPLYLLALRELLGLEPVGGVYRALGKAGEARGMLLASAKEDGAEGFNDRDYLDEESFERIVTGAVDQARDAVRRMRRGDVVHDPRGGSCPDWCDAHTICRVPRP